jgi:hypothetical protein
MPTRFYPLPNRAYPCHPCHLCRCYRVPFRDVPPVPFRVVSNALIMLCRAVPNFLKSGHDTVKTRTRNSTVSVPVPCLNPFRFQPYSYRFVPFLATTCLNLEHYPILPIDSPNYNLCVIMDEMFFFSNLFMNVIVCFEL